VPFDAACKTRAQAWDRKTVKQSIARRRFTPHHGSAFTSKRPGCVQAGPDQEEFVTQQMQRQAAGTRKRRPDPPDHKFVLARLKKLASELKSLATRPTAKS
jgi:hypothetical protein